jgi:hypothetical protein
MAADNQSLLQDSDIVRIASEELQSVLVPYIESVKGEYFVKIQDQTWSASTTSYTMPQRATGTKLRDVCLLDFQGNEVNLPQINPEDIKASWNYAPWYFGFYPQGDKIVLFLGNGVGGGNYASIRMFYFRRPNTLCQTGASGDAASVVSFDTNTNEVTVDLSPTTWDSSTTFDIINNLPPFQSKGDDLAITAIAGNVLTFSASLPSDLKVGDYICEANFAPVAQVPVECQRVLETLTAARCLQYMGDPAFQVFQAQAEDQKRNLIQVLSPRVDGSPQKIPLKNRIWGVW